MTSASPSPGSGDHPEVVEIAALDEGLLPVERSLDVRSHLDVCSLCADTRDSLAEVRNALGTLPGPPRMPDDIAGRIDAALAAEALLDATAPDVSRETADIETPAVASPDFPFSERVEGGDPVPVPGDPASDPTPEPAAADSGVDAVPPGAPVVDSEPTSDSTALPLSSAPASEPHPGTRDSDVSRETATRETARPPGRARGATGPGRSHRASQRRRHRWRTAVLGVAGLAVVLGFGGFYLQSLGGDSAQDSVSQADTAQDGAMASDSLDQRVRRILEEREIPETSQENAPLEAPDPSAREDTSAGSLPSCVREGVARSDQPLAFDEQVFRGQEVYLVVFPHSGDSRQVDAYLVDAGCVTDAPDSPGEVIGTGTYPRG